MLNSCSKGLTIPISCSTGFSKIPAMCRMSACRVTPPLGAGGERESCHPQEDTLWKRSNIMGQEDDLKGDVQSKAKRLPSMGSPCSHVKCFQTLAFLQMFLWILPSEWLAWKSFHPWLTPHILGGLGPGNSILPLQSLQTSWDPLPLLSPPYPRNRPTIKMGSNHTFCCVYMGEWWVVCGTRMAEQQWSPMPTGMAQGNDELVNWRMKSGNLHFGKQHGR